MFAESDRKSNRIILIRHAKTKSNLERRYCGSRSDEDLCGEGIDEAKAMAAAMKYPKADLLFCSPKKRCISTAKIICPGLKPHIITEFDEIDFGDFSGKNYEELANHPEYNEWINSNGTIPFPNGESREAFIERTMYGFQKMLQQVQDLRNDSERTGAVAKKGTEGFSCTVAMVVHGGSIMAVLSTLAGGDYYDYQVGNGCGYICELSFGFEQKDLRIVDRIS